MIDDFQSRPRFAKKGDPEREDFMPDLSSVTTPEQPSAPEVTQPECSTPDPQTSPTSSLPPADDTVTLDEIEATDAAPAPKPPKKPRWWHRITPWFKGLSKKQKILFFAVLLVVVSGLGVGGYALLKPEPPKPAPVVQQPEPEPEPTTVANTLTGRQVEPEVNDRQVIAAMIENSMEARPQSGLQEAGVVFEAIAEGGITRFVALYQDTEPESIGPIRSVRPYYLSWIMGFDAALAHVGGSPEALQNVRDWGSKDLDQMASPGPYQRVTYRYAPHNMYSSYAGLKQLADSKGYTKSSFTGFDRAEAGKPSDTPTASTINVNISSQRYNSSYTYDKATNTYARSMGGVAHSDEKSKKQITPDVVIVMAMNYGIKSNGVHSVYNTVGSGKVFIFQNGTVTEGTWQKTSNESNIAFKDGSGLSLELNPGQTWITAVSDASKVTYQP